ncbi:MAG: queuosine precursor transporter [Kofleriaceae bacterium]
MKLDARIMLFVTLVAVLITCLVVGDLVGGKLTSVHAFGREWVFAVGMLSFPITFVLTDIISEFYGRTAVRRVTVIAFAMVGLTFVIAQAAGAMPWASFTQSPDWTGVNDAQFSSVFTQASRIQLSSMTAFLLASLVDISVFFLLKKLTGNRMLWLRATGSTAISQLFDTAIIQALAFGGKLTPSEYLNVVTTSYLIKLVVAIGITPLIYALHELIEKKLHIEPAPLEETIARAQVVTDATAAPEDSR